MSLATLSTSINDEEARQAWLPFRLARHRLLAKAGGEAADRRAEHGRSLQSNRRMLGE